MTNLAEVMRSRGCVDRSLHHAGFRRRRSAQSLSRRGSAAAFGASSRQAPDSGFDVALAGAIAQQLDRPLKIQWFESKLDEDFSPALEANALLSDGRCSLVGSYALTKDFLVVPGVKTAKLPDFDGATIADRRGRRVPLGVLTPSRALSLSRR